MKLHELKPGEKAEATILGKKTVCWMTESGDVYQDNGTCTNRPAKFDAEMLQADWQLVQEPLPVGEWISEPTQDQLIQQVPEGKRVYVEYGPHRGVFEFCWTTEGAKNLDADPERIYILPDPE